MWLPKNGKQNLGVLGGGRGGGDNALLPHPPRVMPPVVYRLFLEVFTISVGGLVIHLSSLTVHRDN